jgi:7-dehydrocholesterol reductase
MWETLKIIGIFFYSQLTPLIFDYIKEGEVKEFNVSYEQIYYFMGIVFFHELQSRLYYLLPGKLVEGPVTPAGVKPIYKQNGLKAFLITILTQVIILCNMEHEEIDYAFSQLGEFQKSLNIYGIFVVICLYTRCFNYSKAILNEPKYNNNFIVDIYKGVELHPTNKFGDIKLVINSRVGMMIWAMVVVLSLFGSKRQEVFISGVLQLTYILKFFNWEMGYVKTTDIAHDRCGYYLLWGCICYLPCVYTIPTVYHYYHYTEPISDLFQFLVLFCGVISIYLNWSVDTERIYLRENRERSPIVDGKPAKYIHAVYRTTTGEIKQNWLVCCGWMGVARNITYLFEILAALMWSLGGTIPTSIIPYFYVIYLTILLVHRTYRIDQKCGEKYGQAWELYKKEVPYKILPGVF